MAHPKKPRRMINGVEHIECACGCGRWIPYETARSRQYRSNECRNEYMREYREKRKQLKPSADDVKRKKIEKQLKIKGNAIPNNFATCNNEQIQALLNNDVKALLKAKVRDE